jgi:hypothetical protein
VLEANRFVAACDKLHFERVRVEQFAALLQVPTLRLFATARAACQSFDDVVLERPGEIDPRVAEADAPGSA